MFYDQSLPIEKIGLDLFEFAGHKKLSGGQYF